MELHHKQFSLIKFLFTGTITAIWASMASPALSQAQAKGISDFEARTTIANINRAQVFYFLENDDFADTLSGLGRRFPSETINYKYGIVVPQGLDYPAAAHQAQPKKPANKAVIGGVALALIAGEPLLVSLRCLATLSPAQGGPNGTQLPIFGANGAISCPTGYRSI
ncbi:MAG: type IV pilin-like G/H family protein [Coleofasciculus sp. Co-bin14]|nr:type IV pilin-like G/H family protein [Coleofasciculus sp. Co-bin14]